MGGGNKRRRQKRGNVEGTAGQGRKEEEWESDRLKLRQEQEIVKRTTSMKDRRVRA
jgi:hypothetical protein